MPKNKSISCEEELALVKQEFEDFVYLVSHDLKAPIRAINNLAEWVEEDLGPDIPADAKHNLHLLRNRSQRLDKMLAAILDLSRVNRMNLDLETIALSPFLNSLKADFSGDQATFTIPDNLPTITTYAVKLQTVIEQLFDNAIKHNPGKAIHLVIAYQIEEKGLKLSVSDNGAGISPEQQKQIFNIFYTGLGKEKSQSVGAGLTLAKKIVEFVGGNLEFEENFPSGSTFILHWPLKIIQKP